jgi:uncharacterized membrane protein
MSEAKMSALIVAGLTFAGLTLTFGAALRDYIAALEFSGPASLVMGVVLFLTASDGHKKNGGDAPPKGK